MTDQPNDARQNLRLNQDLKNLYTADARKLDMDLPTYTRMALAEQLARTSAKLESRLLAIEKRIQELAEKVDRTNADTLAPFAKEPPQGTMGACQRH